MSYTEADYENAVIDLFKNELNYDYVYGPDTLGQTDGLTRRENFSMVYAKKVVYGCSLASCNIWPFNEAKNFINFIIGVDDDGNEISFTCNPDKLSNVIVDRDTYKKIKKMLLLFLLTMQ